MRLEYKLVDANRVCPGIHKVRVGPDTSSVVATCPSGRGKIVPRIVNSYVISYNNQISKSHSS